MKAGDRLVSSGMGQIYPKNYPVAEIVSVYSDPGLDFATVRARPLAQMASTRHVMLVFPQDQQSIAPIEPEGDARSLIEETPMIQSEIQNQRTD